jgi:hypothetical protein
MCGGRDHGGGLGRSKPFTQRGRAERTGDCILSYADSNAPQLILREGVAIEDALEVTRCGQGFHLKLTRLNASSWAIGSGDSLLFRNGTTVFLCGKGL